VRRPLLLNIDLGELPDEPEPLYEWAHVANIACGGHAGDDASMRRAVERCHSHGARIGAHPSYADREGFGRRVIALPPEALRSTVTEQCARLVIVARALGETVHFVKPHGALYHAAERDPALAEAVIRGAVDAVGTRVTVIGPGRGALASAAARASLGYAREGFADRAVHADGSLLSRDEPGAVLLDPAVCAERARSIVAQGNIETVCVHGDTPGAVSIARAVRAALEASAEV
jgi:UPF0271 protein